MLAVPWYSCASLPKLLPLATVSRGALYLQVSRGDCTLHLSEHHGDCCPGAALRIEVDDIDGLHAELTARQYGYARPAIEDTPWETRELSVKDPFGNRLTFSG